MGAKPEERVETGMTLREGCWCDAKQGTQQLECSSAGHHAGSRLNVSLLQHHS